MKVNKMFCFVLQHYFILNFLHIFFWFTNTCMTFELRLTCPSVQQNIEEDREKEAVLFYSRPVELEIIWRLSNKKSILLFFFFFTVLRISRGINTNRVTFCAFVYFHLTPKHVLHKSRDRSLPSLEIFLTTVAHRSKSSPPADLKHSVLSASTLPLIRPASEAEPQSHAGGGSA